MKRWIVVLLLLVVLVMAAPVCAGTCTFTNELKTEASDSDTEVTSPEGLVVCGVQIKAGQGLYTFYENGEDGCFKVEGLGTSSVTVSELGNPGCHDISHINWGSSVTSVTISEIDARTNVQLLASMAVIVVILIAGISWVERKK